MTPDTETETGKPLLHVAAFWIEGDRADNLADLLSTWKIAGSRGAVVTFSRETADRPSFQRVMDRLDLSEVNDRA